MDHALEVLAAVAVAGLAVMFFGTYWRGREALLVVLGFTAALQTQISKVHLATLVAFVVLVLPRRGEVKDRAVRPAAALIGAAVLIAFSTPLGTLVTNRLLTGQLLLFAITAAIIMLCCSRQEVPLILAGILAGATFGSIVADLQNFGLLHVNYYVDTSGLSRVPGIYKEPDFLAAYAAIGVILAFRLSPRPRWLQLVLLLINGYALVETFARAAFLGLAVSAFYAFALSSFGRRMWQRRSNATAWVAVLLIVVVAFGVSSRLRHTVTQRVHGATTAGSDYSVQARQRQFSALWTLADSAPWHGYGLSASGRVSGYGRIQTDDTATNGVATDWLLGWWVDGKLLAIPLILTFLLMALWKGQAPAGQVLIFVLASSLFSNVMFLPIAWIAFAATALTRREKPVPPPPREDEPPLPSAYVETARRQLAHAQATPINTKS